MSFITFVSFVFLVAYGAAQSEEDRNRVALEMYPSGMVNYNFLREKDEYEFNYNLVDGSYREEVGEILNPGTDEEELVVKGEYGRIYFDPEFGGYRKKGVGYIADKNGYKPFPIIESLSATPSRMQLLSSLRTSLVG